MAFLSSASDILSKILLLKLLRILQIYKSKTKKNIFLAVHSVFFTTPKNIKGKKVFYFCENFFTKMCAHLVKTIKFALLCLEISKFHMLNKNAGKKTKCHIFSTNYCCDMVI